MGALLHRYESSIPCTSKTNPEVHKTFDLRCSEVTMILTFSFPILHSSPLLKKFMLCLGIASLLNYLVQTICFHAKIEL